VTRASLVGLREGGFLVLDASAISDGAVDLRRAAGRVGDEGAQVSNGWRALTDVYQSPVAPGLVTAMEPVGQVASEMSGAMQMATVALDDYARAISSLQARHRSVAVDAEVFARAATASPDWRIEPALRAHQSSLQQSVATLESDFDDARQQCVAVLDGIVAPTVQSAGSFASTRTGSWDPRALGSLSTLGTLEPTEVNSWWTSLSLAAQSMYLATEPQLIGGLDGIPSTVRDAANRSRLDGELARLVAERDALGFFDRNVASRTLSDELNEKIDAIRAISRVLRHGDRKLLVFDVSGREALAAVAVGDVDSAKNVSVLVGGTGTNVETGLNDFDQDAWNMRRRASAVGEVPIQDVAVVGWVGYRAPSELWLAHDPRYAVEGRADLEAFVHGISVTSQHSASDLNLTLGGHSYAAMLVTSAVLDRTTPVDSVATYGTPGIASGPFAPQVDKYWLANGDDPIRAAVVAGVFADQPNVEAGWTELDTSQHEIGGTTYLRGVQHKYLQNGSMTQYNLAALIAGRKDLLVPYDEGR
jgi:hypothetical protein